MRLGPPPDDALGRQRQRAKGRLERVAGIEPAPRAWKARVIPFHHTRSLTLVHISWVMRRQALKDANGPEPAPAVAFDPLRFIRRYSNE